VLICAGIIIWVGAARLFVKGSQYAVYFDESVQGLQVDSAIKYRGVEIGKVQSIDVAPDYRLIEVNMKIDLEGDLHNQTIASLKTAGITGIVFIELDRIKPGELANSPKLTFKTDYPVIPFPQVGNQSVYCGHQRYYAKHQSHRLQGDLRSNEKHLPGHRRICEKQTHQPYHG